MLFALPVAMGGSILGSKAAEWMMGKGPKQPDIGQQITVLATQMNSLLQQALNNAISSSTAYTNKAISVSQLYGDRAIGVMGKATAAANNQATQALNFGLGQYMAMNAPFARAGYVAQDDFMNTLGRGPSQAPPGSPQSIPATAVWDAFMKKPPLQQAPQYGNLFKMPPIPTIQGDPSVAQFQVPDTQMLGKQMFGKNWNG